MIIHNRYNKIKLVLCRGGKIEKGAIIIYGYGTTQWILFFFLYCFIGWVWESCYVTMIKGIKTKKFRFINRGFLNGPFLPIYGCAAMVILFAAIPVKGQYGKVFLFGMIAATLMELITGSAMERLFHVKYWDYSNLPLNYKGYICIFPSLFWGICSLLLVEVLHVPVAHMVRGLNRNFSEILAFVLVAVFVCDVTVSFNEAMDMRDLLEALSEQNEAIRKLERRLDAYIAFRPLKEKMDLSRVSKGTKLRLQEKAENFKLASYEYLNRIKERLQLPDMEDLKDKEALQELLEGQIRSVFSRNNKQFAKAARHLKRNPGAISKKYADALQEIKNLFEKED